MTNLMIVGEENK